MKGLPGICDETGADESLLIGSREQLAQLANMINEALTGEQSYELWHNVRVKFVPSTGRLTDALCDTSISSVVIVAGESQRRELINKIRSNNGDSPIDWDNSVEG